MKKLIYIVLLLFATGSIYGQRQIPKSDGLRIAPKDAPSTPIIGEIYFDSISKSIWSWNGVNWDSYTILSKIDTDDIAEGSTNLFTTPTSVSNAGALMDDEVDGDIKTLSLPENTTISAFGKTVIDDIDEATMRATLGLGSLSTLSFINSGHITDGTITNIDISDSAAISGSKIAHTPSGNIAATTGQAAINELDSEKGGKASTNIWTSNQIFEANPIIYSQIFQGQIDGVSDRRWFIGKDISQIGGDFIFSRQNADQINIGGSYIGVAKINASGTPTDDTDLTDKAYVDGLISGVTVTDGSITNAKLADAAVTSTKILDNTILNADINSGAGIDAVKIALSDSGTYFPTDNVEAGMEYLAIAVEAVPTLINSNDFTGATTTNVNSATGTKNYIDTAINNSLLLGSESFTSSRSGLITDADGIVLGDNASAITYTVPTNASVPYPVNTVIKLKQTGAGNITLAYAGGVTGEAGGTYGVNSTIIIRKTGTNTWEVLQHPASRPLTQTAYDALTPIDGILYLITGP
jgi:hypothetical protein